LQTSLLAGALTGLAAGGVFYFLKLPAIARVVWAVAAVIVLIPTVIGVLNGLRRRETGVDIIALLAIGSALALGEFLTGAIIAVMLTGGAMLEQFATARARRELRSLLKRAPRTAHHIVGVDVSDVPVEAVAVGDILLVKSGEVVPTDGIIHADTAVVDESALTGEFRHGTFSQGASLRSGGTNAGGPFKMRVTHPAAESTYAAVVRLVKEAEQSKAPFVRLADRYALGFLALAIVLAAGAWMISGSPQSALAVLVVATPCPLIIAVPAALIAGVSRAAKHGVIIKGGGPLEALARTTVLLLDKTGTVTSGRPRVVGVESFGVTSSDDVVRYAASVEQVSLHPYAPAIVEDAKGRNLQLSFPTAVHEQMGTGVVGTVGEHRVAVGQLAFVAPDAPVTAQLRALNIRTAVEGSSSVYVAIDSVLAGALLLQDTLRPEAPRVLRSLRDAGIRRIHIVTGDHPDVAELVGDVLGVDHVFAERTPEEKVEVIQAVRSEGVTAMVGDGVNDAPALALADVGIAMGARGATAASEAADIVLTADKLEGLLLATQIAQRTRRIAVESVVAGMSLSVIAMIFAAAGQITPVFGAILQEGIDVLVIANALRALGGTRRSGAKGGVASRLAQVLATTHRTLQPLVSELSVLAARLDSLPAPDAQRKLQRLYETLVNELLPHERHEQEVAYPLLIKLLREEDPTGPLIRTHQEIQRLTRLLGRLIAQLPSETLNVEDLRDVRRVLYGLHAILTLHFAQEEELYSVFET